MMKLDVAVPLPEDRDLQGFLPLEKSFGNLRFTNTALESNIMTVNKLRAVRILHLGCCLAQYQINGSTPISIMMQEETGNKRFISMSNGSLSNELMKELEELSLNKKKQSNMSMSPTLSETASSKGSLEIDIEMLADKKIFQSILKPQGSLERNRDSLTNIAEASDIEISSFVRKPRQNIAMQAIMRRAETEQKQVTFKNVSPAIVEEENENKKVNVTVPLITTSIANKPKMSISEMTIPSETLSMNNTHIGVQNQQLIMPIASLTSRNILVQNQPIQRHTKLPLNVSIPVQVNQLISKEQQVIQQILPQMHVNMTAQCDQQVSTLRPICYTNQSSFNVQNPQFAKNFIANRPQTTSVSRYQIQEQLNNGHLVSAIPQSLNGITHTISQSRPLHHRVSQNVSHSPAQLLQQTMRLGSAAQQNINLQTNMGLQSAINMEQKNCAIDFQHNAIQNCPRSNGMSNQLNIDNSTNMSTIMSTLYEKDSQKQSLPSLANTQIPTSTNFQLNFDHTQALSQPLSNQLSQSYYKDSDVTDFSFPNQTDVAKVQKLQPQTSTNKYMFGNYELTEHFNLWKDNRPPQPPITWWGSVSNTATTQVHMKDSIASDSNTFSNWNDLFNLGNIANRMSLAPDKNYQQLQQNGQHDKHLMAENNFENPRLFEVSILIALTIHLCFYNKTLVQFVQFSYNYKKKNNVSLFGILF